MDKERTVSFSQTTINELMIPAYANFGGKIHGGILLSLMDKVAYSCAAKHASSYCVTVSVDNAEFLQPVEVGEMVSLKASVNHVGNSSMLIGIRVTAENFEQGTEKHTNTCYFTMVAKNKDGTTKQVPALILQTREEVRRYLESIKRKEIKKTYNYELDNAKTRLSVEEELYMLKGQRCKVEWEPGV